MTTAPDGLVGSAPHPPSPPDQPTPPPDLQPFWRLVFSVALAAKRIAEVLAPSSEPAHLDLPGRCGVCFEYALTSPCPRCISANRGARLAEGWDRPRDVLTPEETHPASPRRLK